MPPKPKLGIIAGRGDLPDLILDAARAEGRPVFVLALEGQTSEDLVRNVEHVWIPLGAVGRGLDALGGAGVRDVVFAGGVRRPSLLKLGLDGRAVRLMANVGKAALGDDKLLSVIIAEIESEGFSVVGADDILHDLLVEEGVLGRLRPDEVALSDIARGLEVAGALGAVDVGQAVVVQQGIVLGVEAIEGTDALIARSASVRREGPGGVLIKIKKPGQERRADLPTIGLSTVTAAAEAGLRGIAVEAGATLVIGRETLVAAADAAGLFVTAIRVSP
ncbi:MAG: LpxI family protein [Alphaproteobacteria bacterium]